MLLPSVARSVSWLTTTSGSASATARATAAASNASATTGVAPACSMAAALAGVRVMPVTSWPAAISAGTSPRPTAPVAPATKILMTDVPTCRGYGRCGCDCTTPVGDVERPHGVHAALGAVDHEAGLVVDPGRADAVAAPALAQGHDAGDEPGHLGGPVHGLARGHHLAAAVAVGRRVGGQHRDQRVGVALGGGAQEALGQLGALGAVGVEARAAVLDVALGPHQQLAAVVRRALHHPRDLLVLVAEHLAQQEHRALDRAQLLQQHQERLRQRVRGLGALVGAGLGVGQQRLGQPGADVGLTAHARRAQVVDREPRDHGRDERLRRLDRWPCSSARITRSSASWTRSSASATLPTMR